MAIAEWTILVDDLVDTYPFTETPDETPEDFSSSALARMEKLRACGAWTSCAKCGRLFEVKPADFEREQKHCSDCVGWN